MRECVEETVPASCPEVKSLCRQHIYRVRCVLPPPPTDCSQITCRPGMFCRKGFRGKRSIYELGNVANLNALNLATTENGPLCNKLPSSCEEAACPEETVFSIFSQFLLVVSPLPSASAKLKLTECLFTVQTFLVLR